MGNLCGKEGSASPAPVGHVLGSAPAAATRQKAKNPKKPKVTGPGRTLGASGSNPSRDGEPQSTLTDARAAAALAAEVWGRLIHTPQVNMNEWTTDMFSIATVECPEEWEAGSSAGPGQAEDTESAHPGFGKDQGTTGGVGLGLEFFVFLMAQCFVFQYHSLRIMWSSPPWGAESLLRGLSASTSTYYKKKTRHLPELYPCPRRFCLW